MKLIKKLRILRELIYEEERGRDKPYEIRSRFPGVTFSTGTYADSKSSFNSPVALAENVVVLDSCIGKYSYVAANSHIYRCNVGSFCSIGPLLLTGLGMHPSRNFVSTHPSFYAPTNSSPISFVNQQRFAELKRILIGNDVWIGARVTIVDGVMIGDGAIIAAGAVVASDVEPYSIVGGVPAKLIRKRFTNEQIAFLLKFKWWEKSEEWLSSNAFLFDNVENFINELSKE